jgi:hypothetical protein
MKEEKYHSHSHLNTSSSSAANQHSPVPQYNHGQSSFPQSYHSSQYSYNTSSQNARSSTLNTSQHNNNSVIYPSDLNLSSNSLTRSALKSRSSMLASTMSVPTPVDNNHNHVTFSQQSISKSVASKLGDLKLGDDLNQSTLSQSQLFWYFWYLSRY